MRTRNAGKEMLVKEKAIALLVEEGLDGFSMNKLAKACSISVATLYIYYIDKDDLIKKLGVEEGMKMTAATMKNFDPGMPFDKGMKTQWENRSAYWIRNPVSSGFLEALRHSPHGEYVNETIAASFRPIMKKFVEKAIAHKELVPLPLEVFWSLAFGPLLTLIRFHKEKKSVGQKPFTFSNKLMYQTLDLVLKALRP